MNMVVQEHVLQPHSRRKLSLHVEGHTATPAPTPEAAPAASAPLTSSATGTTQDEQQETANGQASDQSQDDDHSSPATGKEDDSPPDTSANGHPKPITHESKAVQQEVKVQRVDDIWAWKRRQSVAASPR